MPIVSILVILGVVVAVVVIVGVIITSSSERTLVEERLGRYLEDEDQKAKGEPGTSAISERVNRIVAQSSYGDRLARDLADPDVMSQAWH